MNQGVTVINSRVDLMLIHRLLVTPALAVDKGCQAHEEHELSREPTPEAKRHRGSEE